MKARELDKVARYTRKIAKNPEDFRAYYKRAKILLELEEYQKAAIDLNLAINLESKNAEFFYYRGLAYLGLKEYYLAIEDWTKAIELNLESVDIYVYRGQARAKIQDYELAIEDFSKSIAKNPQSSIGYSNRASVYFVRENYELALRDYQKTLALDPNNKIALFNSSIAIELLQKQGKQVKSLSSKHKSSDRDQQLIKNKREGNNYLGILFSLLVVGYITVQVIPNSISSSEIASLEVLRGEKTNRVKNSSDRLEARAINKLNRSGFKFKNSSTLEGIFNYGGSTVWTPIRNKIDREIIAANYDFKLRYLPHPLLDNSSSVGIKMLIENQLDFAQSSRPLKAAERQIARENGFELKQIPVAIDGVAIATNPDLNISGLSIDEIRGIYSGKITNWQEVGGPDLPIIPYSKSPQKSGTAHYFVKNVLDNKNISPQVKVINDTDEALELVNNNKGAIFYESAAKIVPQCFVRAISIGYDKTKLVSPYHRSQKCTDRPPRVNLEAFRDASYPLTQKLYVVIKENGSIEERVGWNYAEVLLSDSGQKALEKIGFVSIR